MREIPAEVQTLLKSRSMIGDNKPTCEVILNGGKPDDSESVWGPVYAANNLGTRPVGLSFCTRPDGKILVTYQIDNDVMLSTVDNETALLKTNNAASANQWVFYNRYSTEKGVNNSSLQKMDDGSIYLYLYESGVIGDATKPEILKVFKSTNGGDDFFELATVFTRALTDGLIYRFGDSNHVGNAFRLGSGRIFLSCMAWQNSGLGYAQPAQYCCYSDDDGATWKRSVIKEASSFYAPAITTGIGVAGNRLISCWVQSTGVRPSHLAYSTDNGVTWTDHEYYSGTGGNNMEVFFGGDGFTYLLFNVSGNEYSVFRHKSADNIDFTGQKPYEIGAIGSGATWEGPLYGGPLAADFIDGYAAAYITDMMTVVIIESGSNTQSAFRELAKVTPKSILIDRQKGMAGSLEIVLDNKDGKYSPDNTGTDYEHIFWPNSEIVVRQGYGGNLIKTFAALVDSVTETSFPQEIRISCRDYLKKSLDQIVSMPWQGGTSHNLTYWDRSPEWIFADLCSKAGIATGTIEATGIVINEKTFSWESYMDAFVWLAQASGNFEVIADEDGLVSFRRDTVPTDATAVYTFREGEDIFSLSYEISDQDIYTKVAVYGKTPDTTDANGNTVAGHVVFAARDYVSRNYYKVFPQKYLKIDAGASAGTVEACQAIADQAETLMRSRVRTVTFGAVAVPWLQVGDVIQVIESSSTISELYRVTSISSNMDDGGYTMTIVCYHHGAA